MTFHLPAGPSFRWLDNVCFAGPRPYWWELDDAVTDFRIADAAVAHVRAVQCITAITGR